MPQQYVFGSPNDKYKKKLFVDTGTSFMEVKARIVEPYTPPTPQFNVKELKIVNAPSHIQNMGISSYKATLTLLFNDKQSYSEYLMWCGWTHKFYDEKGSIYLGSVENMKVSIHEAERRYLVEIDLVLVKKDVYKEKDRFEFQDISGHWAEQDIREMANLGLITVITRDGQPVLYFRPNAYITRAEFITFLNRTRRLLDKIIQE
jgi:hypothetical protein